MQEMQETQVRSLDGEDPLEKEMATHSSILAWRISRTEKPSGLQSMGSQTVGHDLATNTHAHTHTLLKILRYSYKLNFGSEILRSTVCECECVCV